MYVAVAGSKGMVKTGVVMTVYQTLQQPWLNNTTTLTYTRLHVAVAHSLEVECQIGGEDGTLQNGHHLCMLGSSQLAQYLIPLRNVFTKICHCMHMYTHSAQLLWLIATRTYGYSYIHVLVPNAPDLTAEYHEGVVKMMMFHCGCGVELS